MMKRGEMIFKRVLATGISAAMIAGSLAGCGKNKVDENSMLNQATSTSKDYVFTAQKLDNLPEGDYNSIKMIGDRIYVSTYADGGFLNIYNFNSDGSDVKTVRISQKGNESYANWTFDKEGNMYCIHNIFDWTQYEDEEPILYEENGAGEETEADTDPEAPADAGASETSEEPADSGASEASEAPAEDGTEGASNEEDASDAEGASEAITDSEDYIDTEGDQQFLVKFDKDGKEVFSIDLKNFKTEDEDYYIYSMIYSEGNGLLISSVRGIETLDESSQSFSTIVNTKENGSELYDRTINLFEGQDGKLFIYTWGDKGIEFRSFDPKSKNFGEISKAFNGYNDYYFFGGNGYDIYVAENDGFYGYDASKDTATKILDYMDSDLGNTSAITAAVAISDKEFLANIPDEEYNYTAYRLTKVPADQVKDKKIITVAGNYISYDLRKEAAAFNKENDEYRIKFIDYSSLASEDDWNAGKTQMNLDIVSGNIPDIMVFDSEDSLSSYINKGLFLDLNSLIANDPDLGNAKFLDNVMNALSTNGKLYQIAESFYIQSVATKTRYLEGKTALTIKDCDDLIEKTGVNYAMSYGLCGRDEMLTQGLASAGKNYIDWEKKSCNFDSDEFVEFLEFVNKFPEEINDSYWEDYKETCYRDGTAIFSNAYIYSFNAYKRMEAGAFGEDITMVGYPNSLGVNCSMICPNNRFTISSQSKNTEGAWQFLRKFFLPERQDAIENDFPVLQSSFDKMAEKSMERNYYLDENGKKVYEDDTYYLGDTEVVIEPLTKDEVEKVKNFVYSVDKVYDYNQSVSNIINEEVSAYFSGQKTAKEVASIIQSRVSIYVNENS